MSENSGAGSHRNDRYIRGTSVSKGYAFGKAFIYRDILSHDIERYNIAKKDVKGELNRVHDAFSKVLVDIKRLEDNVKKELGEEEAAIFSAHAEILKDETVRKKIEKLLKKNLINAEHAVKRVFREFAERMRQSESETLRTKADDIDDLSRRILCSFMNCEIGLIETVPPRSIIVARRLLPSDTVRLKKKNVKGIVIEQGSDVSHTAIMARAMGIPALTDVQDAVSAIEAGEKLVLDGYKGLIICSPTASERRTYSDKAKRSKQEEARLISRARRLAKTSDGKRIKVYANVASSDEMKTATARGYDGIGLVRIEQIYMSAKSLPTERHLLRKLEKMLPGEEKKVITLRLLDVGGDKTLPYMDIAEEPSPALGLRGIRILLKYKNLLRTQIRVAMLLSKGRKIRLLVPMVTFSDEMRQIREIAKECISDLRKKRGIRIRKFEIGAMIETPAAVENIQKIARESDFLSIGTNDLIQYAVAAGRNNPSVVEYYEIGAGLVIKYIRRVVRAAKRHGIECSVCGEMASESDWVKPLVKAGVEVLSVSPYLIPQIKEEVRRV